MARSHLIPAARVVLYLNGAPYAQVTSFRWDSATPHRAIYALDSGEPYELAPTTTKITGSVGLLRLIGDGGIEGRGASTHYADLPRQKYFSLSLIEREFDLQLFRSERCRVTSQSWDVPARGLITGAMAFEGLDWNNEVQPRTRY